MRVQGHALECTAALKTVSGKWGYGCGNPLVATISSSNCTRIDKQETQEPTDADH